MEWGEGLSGWGGWRVGGMEASREVERERGREGGGPERERDRGVKGGRIRSESRKKHFLEHNLRIPM